MCRCVSSASGFLRRSAEKAIEGAIRHGEAGHEIEVAQVEAEGAVWLEIDQLRQDQVAKDRFAVGGETHHFVFPGVDPKTEVVGEGGVEQAERMRETQIGQQLDPVPFPAADACRRPFPHPIDRQHRRVFEGRREKRGGGVGFVMLRENDCAFKFELPANDVLEPDLLLHPDRHGLEERAQPERRAGQVGGKQPVELQEWLLVKGDEIELLAAR